MILRRTLKGYRWPLLIMALLLMGLGAFVPTSYDSFGPQSFPELWEQMPRGATAFLRAEGSLLIAAGPQGYVAIVFRHPIFLVLLTAFAIASASSALAGEIERRTILVLLARPLHRYRLVISRGLGSLLGLALIVAALVAGTFIGVSAGGLGDSVDFGPFLLIGVNAMALALAVLGYSYLFSSLSSDGGRAILASTALSVAFFFIDFISGLFDLLEPLGLLSVFHYYDPVSLAVDSTFPALHLGVLVATAAATFGGAVVVFQRRDIAA